MSELLDGKVAIVTGAAKGLGQAIAERLAGAGATVVCADIDAAGAESTAAGLANGSAVRCDVTSESEVEALVSDTVSAHGKLDVMVTCAGIAIVKPLTEMSLDEWRSVLHVNLDGVFLCTKYAGRAMAAGGGGSIINMSSIKAFGGAPATGNYGAAKAGVVSLSKTAAMELRPFGVRVNAVCPGWFATDMVNDRKGELESVLGIPFDDYIGHIQGRLGEPSEIAGVVLFLASERSRFSSGGAYVVDNGATASLV